MEIMLEEDTMNTNTRMLIPEFEINQQIEKRIAYLEKVKVDVKGKIVKLPEGDISAYKGSAPNSFRYYRRNSRKDKHGEYLGKTKSKERNDLAQKKYFEKLLENIDSELSKLKRIRSVKLNDSIVQTYSSLNPGIKRLISPINVDDRSFAEIWSTESYDGLKFEEYDNSQFFSYKGERMRSKSEVLIANALLNKGIPYKYEYPLQLSNGKIKYPDFTILNLRERRIKYWEHLGKMGDVDYISYNLKKLEEYKNEGIVLGDNLIITMESGSMPLRTRNIDKIIECLFLKKDRR